MADATQANLTKIAEGIRRTYEMRDPARFFEPAPLDAGQEVLKRKFARMPMIPKATRQAVVDQVDRLRSDWQEGRAPQTRVTVEISMADYRTMASGVNAPGAREAIVNALQAGVMYAMFITPSDAGDAADVPSWGLLDAGTGNGTHSRPLLAGTGSAAGAWATAGYGQSDLSSIQGLIRKHYPFATIGGETLGLYYPSIAEVPLHLGIPEAESARRFRDLAQEYYAWMEPVPDILNAEPGAAAISALTGNTENATDFELVAVNPSWFQWLYDIPPIFRIYTNEHQDRAYIQAETHGTIIPIPWLSTNDKVYKAVSIIDACGS